MTLSRLVFRSMRKNMKQYYLYFFALIFSVMLCFSFVTLQSNPTVEKALEESGTATAGFEAATYVLYFIVTFFVLYANHLFMKRRSKEIGLYQLIGMTKGLIIRLIALENIILFVFAVLIGMVTGFLSSRLFAMMLLKLLEMDDIVTLSFSIVALQQSVMIFSILLVVILIQMVWMIRRVTLISLFNAAQKADERIKRFSIFHMIMGILGVGLIIYGYYESTRLFELDENRMRNLFGYMLLILVSTILGTFLFFRYSVALMMNIIRSRKKGHLNIKDVMAVTPIMHRMKGNSKSLTLITTLTGLAVGIITLSYIGYYSSETSARQSSPYDYTILNNEGYEFLDQLQLEGIDFEKDTYKISKVSFSMKNLINDELQNALLFDEDIDAETPVVSLTDYRQVNPNFTLENGDAIITSYANYFSEIMPLEKERYLLVQAGDKKVELFIRDIKKKDYFLHQDVSFGGAPVLVVTDEIFEQLSEAEGNDVFWTSQIGINLLHEQDQQRAEEIYEQLKEQRTVYGEIEEDGHVNSWVPKSFEQLRKDQISMIGTTVFVTAFLGLAFLLTTGSILYFKQMSEAEEEKDSYTTLRKIGFSTQDLMRGIYAKQAFNFGVPLVIGLLHSYFAVKSGWFLFGSELVAPLVITMSLYVAMYAVFSFLSTAYYKKIIKSSL